MRIEWTGEGLPPVGAVCEYFSALGEWKVCRIVAHDGLYAVFNSLNEYGAHIADGFRPIRTPEQIAAEDREAKAKALYCTINWDDGEAAWSRILDARKDDFRKAIDAGWQQVKP